MEKYKFSNYNTAIQEKLKGMTKTELGINEKVSLIEGFFQSHFTEEYSESVVLGGMFIPTIVLVGESGQLYFFAIKKLFPNFPKID